MNNIENNKLEKLKKILEISSRDTISAKEVEQFLTLVLNTVKTERESFKNLSEEQIAVINEKVSFIDGIKDDFKSLFVDEINEAKKLLKEISKIKATPGKDGNDYILTDLDKDEIASLIEVPIVEKIIEKTETIKEIAQEIVGEEIVSKINDLEITPELQIDAKHIKNLPKQSTQFVGGSSGITEIVAGTNITVDNSNPKYPIVSSSGGGGGSGTVTSVDMSVPAGLTISGNPITTSGTLVLGLDIGYVIPLQSTLDAKQDTLVSSTNIKTINGSSILGAGDLSISGVGTGTANTIAYWDTTTSIASLATATYPSLTELSYVKGVTTAIQTQLNAKESALTFSTGLTRATNTITNNLSTGVSGGQSVIGGNAASNALTLSSTSNATKGKIIMGTGFAYHENTQRLSVGGTTDLGFTLGVAGTLAAQQSVYFAQNSGNVTFGSTLNTGQVSFSVKQSTNTGLGWIFGYDSFSTNGFYIYTNETTASPNFNIYTGATQRLTIYGTTSMVLNEAGANFDIRMEGDTNVNLFFSDASVDRIGIGHGAPDRLLHVEQADAVTNAVTYPFRVTHTSSGTVTTNFGVGQEFEAENASNTNRVIGTHEFIYSDATNATEDATYKLRLIKAGTLTDALTVDSLGAALFAGDVTVPDEAYGVSWNGSLEVPTKNAVYDKIETLSYTPAYLGITATPNSAQTTVANTAYTLAITVPVACTITKVAVYIGVSSGNIDVGIYNSSGTRLGSSGSVASPGVGSQLISLSSSVALTPGFYYLAVAADNATISLGRYSTDNLLGSGAVATSFPLPSTLTTPIAVSSRAYSIAGVVSGGVTQ